MHNVKIEVREGLFRSSSYGARRDDVADALAEAVVAAARAHRVGLGDLIRRVRTVGQAAPTVDASPLRRFGVRMADALSGAAALTSMVLTRRTTPLPARPYQVQASFGELSAWCSEFPGSSLAVALGRDSSALRQPGGGYLLVFESEEAAQVFLGWRSLRGAAQADRVLQEHPAWGEPPVEV